MWGSFVELLRAAIFGAAHVCGGSLGSGVLLVSAVVRLALLPLTLRLARRAREQQAKLATLKPQLDALQRRYADAIRAIKLYATAVADACLEGSKSVSAVPNKDEYVAADGSAE